MKVAFLDRDGTLNVDHGYVHKPEDVQLVPGAKEALHKLVENDYKLILVTNQSGIGRGFFTEEQLHETNARLQEFLNSVFLKSIFAPTILRLKSLAIVRFAHVVNQNQA